VNDIDDAKAYLKVRLALVAALAVVVTTGVIGLIDVVTSVSVDAMPLYVHVAIGASVFPVTYFLLEYRDIEEELAIKVGLSVAFTAVVGVGLLAEGTDRLITDLGAIGAPTLFYATSIGLIAATLAVTWVQRRVIRPLAEAPATGPVTARDGDR
jgi:hypothetical protein